MYFDNIEKSRLLTRVLTVVGLWPKQSTARPDCPRYWRCYQLLLHTTLTLLLTVLMWLDVLWAENLDHATHVLGYALTEMGLVLKICNIWWYERAAVQLLHEWATSDEFALRSGAERRMWQRVHDSFGKVCAMYIFIAVNTGLSAFVAVPFMREKRLPFSYWLPATWHERYFWWTFAYNITTMMFTCLCNIQLDLLNCFMMVHLTTSFKVIGMRLERLGEGIDESDPDPASDDQIIDQLVSIIKLHRRIKGNVAQCERIISLPILVQILLTSFVLCFAIYQLRNVHFGKNPGEFSVVMQYAMAICLQIFIPCYYANMMTTSAQRLAYRLFSANWMQMSRKNRRLVLLTMGSLSQPLKLRAGSFFHIGLPIFSKTINNAYSLLALLLNVSDKTK